MNNGWTPERKAKQASAIETWKPWQMCTGPKTQDGKATVSRNSYKGGTRPKHREELRKEKLALWLLKNGWMQDTAEHSKEYRPLSSPVGPSDRPRAGILRPIRRRV